MSRKKRLLVAMSGGVDSSVAAAILKRQGHDVVGVTMQIWQESQTDPRHSGCCSLGAVEDARRVARLLQIPHYVVNMKDEFKQSVIDNFVAEYVAGRTPNPCVQCNKHVKFAELMAKMREFGCDQLVTGHYARIRRNPRSNRYELWRARGEEKDQSYVLFMLDQQQLASTRFPLGELPDKSATRKIAYELGLPVAGKPDSQEICFVGEAGGYREFLKKTTPESFSEGEIVDESGQPIGTHTGVAGFTVGQRRGVGVASRDGRPLFVLKVEPATNTVVVGNAEGLESREVHLIDAHWGKADPNANGVKVLAKIRYNMDPKPARLYGGTTPHLVFDEPVRAATPGQFAVAYIGKAVAGGGTISGTKSTRAI